MEHHETITCSDGVELAASVFGGATPDWIVINSAMGVRRQFYRALANYLAEAGFHVVTYDYRGIGESLTGSVNDNEARLYEWGELDFDAVLRHVQQERAARTIAVIGHSVGAQIVGLSAANESIDAVVAVATQSGYWRNWTGLGRIGMYLLWHVGLPGVTRAVGHFPGRLVGGSVDLPPGIARDWAACGRDPDYIRGSYARESDRHFATLRAPVLALSITDDRYAPRAATEALLAWYENAPHEIVEVTPKLLGVRQIGHFGWFRQEIGTRSWQQTLNWLRETTTG